MWCAEFSPESNPKGKIHFSPTRVGDVAKIDNIVAFSAKIFGDETRHLRFRGWVVAADEQVVIVGRDRWIDHHFAIHRVERFDDNGFRKLALDPFA